MNFEELVSSSQEFPFLNQEVLHQTSMGVYDAFAYQTCLIDTALYNKYEEHDLRKQLYFSAIDPETIRFMGQYHGSTVGTVQFTGIALDEMYLNRAESNAHLDQLGDALNDVKLLLIKRYETDENGDSYYVPPSITTKEDVLNYIYEERQKELLLRGIRWTDLRRKSVPLEFKKVISRIVKGQQYTIEPNSHKFTLPIPTNEINYSNIEQNPNWD